MSVHDEEEFELVLGNRQLFFLAVVLFAVFFSIGYTVGYSRGRESADEVAAASRPATASQTLPQVIEPEDHSGSALEPLAAAPSSPEAETAAGGSVAMPQLSASAAAQGSLSAPKLPPANAPARPSAALETPKAPPVTRPAAADAPVASAARATERKAPAATTARAAAPQLQQDATATIAVPAIEPGAIYLQVLASREADPAREALVEMRAKGHSVTLDNSEEGWYRILIGPFREQKDAGQYQLRLKQEGIDSFIRIL